MDLCLPRLILPRLITVCLFACLGNWAGMAAGAPLQTDSAAATSPAQADKPGTPAAQPEAEQPAAAGTDSQPDTKPDTKKYKLVYQFHPDQVVRYQVTHKMTITNQFNDSTDIARNKSESRKSFRVVSVDEQGNGEVEVQLDWVQMTSRSSDSQPEIVFKSDDPDAQPAEFRHILKSLGKPQARIQIAPAGQIRKVKLLNNPAQAPKNQPETDWANETILSPMPDEPVAVGDSWKHNYEVSVHTTNTLKTPISMMCKYTLTAVQDGKASIHFKTSVLSPVNDSSISIQLIQRETTGTIEFDIDRGLLLNRKVDVDRTVINPFGSTSSMRAVSHWQERLLPDEAATTSSDTSRK